jgi:hypothetical protein
MPKERRAIRILKIKLIMKVRMIKMGMELIKLLET